MVQNLPHKLIVIHAIKMFPPFLRNRKFYNRVYKPSVLDPFSSHFNPANLFMPHFIKIDLNIISSSMLKLSLSLMFSDRFESNC